jgi:hypothetical protein
MWNIFFISHTFKLKSQKDIILEESKGIALENN